MSIIMNEEVVLKSLVLLLLISILTLGQDTVSNVLFDDTSIRLEKAIYDMNARQNAAAYNIANATTPGFRPIRFEDEIQEAVRLYGNANMLNDVNVDDEMVKTTKVRLRHSAYVRLLNTKIGITKKVVTLGKGG